MGRIVIGGGGITIGGGSIVIGGSTRFMRTVTIDIGDPSQQSASPINNITTITTGVKLTAPTDDQSVNTGIKVEFLEAFASILTNANGPLHGFPQSVVDDSFATSGTNRRVEITFPAAHIGISHQFTYWGANAVSDDTRITTYDINDVLDAPLVPPVTQAVHNPKNEGAAAPVSNVFIVPPDGIIHLNVSKPTTALAWGLLEMAYTLPTEAPTLTTPYPDLLFLESDAVSVDLNPNITNDNLLTVEFDPAINSGLSESGGIISGTVTTPTSTAIVTVTGRNSFGKVIDSFQLTTLTTGDPSTGINVSINS